MKNNFKNNLELLATQLAELRLSELGFRLIPGVFPVFRRLHQFISARALIMKPKEAIL